MSDGALLDLVCGPASPLPETYQRYRLVAHLGSGGQAEVYRAVRLCGGVSSAPMTVKVFRVDPCRPLVDELRSWDKGDAALMDLNNRGVPGICRRADGFYGPPPHRPGEQPPPGEAVPYQIYDYLHGINLREYVSGHGNQPGNAHRLNGIGALRILAQVLEALHDPKEPGATPVLHMDIKPANIMVLTNGDIRLIDFTGARYWRDGEITQISYTRESGGPEAFGGAREMGPPYDVHGFGAVAFHLVTGLSARVDSDSTGQGAEDGPARPTIRRLPALDRHPALRDHLYAPLADNPGERPRTAELAGWSTHLGDLVRRADLPDLGIDWTPVEGGEISRAVGRATPTPAVNGTETSAFQRIERLERELVELRGEMDVPGENDPTRITGPARGAVDPTRLTDLSHGSAQPHAVDQTRLGDPAVPVHHLTTGGQAGHAAPTSPPPQGNGPVLRGRARVPSAPRARNRHEDDFGPAPVNIPDPWQSPYRADPRVLKRGWEYTAVGGAMAFLCWGIWALSSAGDMVSPLISLVIVPLVAGGLFALCRLVGRMVIEQRLGRRRHTAKGSHAVTGIFLGIVGIAYLQQIPWVNSFEGWVKGILS